MRLGPASGRRLAATAARAAFGTHSPEGHPRLPIDWTFTIGRAFAPGTTGSSRRCTAPHCGTSGGGIGIGRPGHVAAGGSGCSGSMGGMDPVQVHQVRHLQLVHWPTPAASGPATESPVSCRTLASARPPCYSCCRADADLTLLSKRAPPPGAWRGKVVWVVGASQVTGTAALLAAVFGCYSRGISRPAPGAFCPACDCLPCRVWARRWRATGPPQAPSSSFPHALLRSCRQAGEGRGAAHAEP